MKSDVIQKCKTARQLIEIDLEKKENLIKVDKIDLGFGVETNIKKLLSSDTVSKKQVIDFKKECQKLVVAMVTKIIDKSPLLIFFDHVPSFILNC